MPARGGKRTPDHIVEERRLIWNQGGGRNEPPISDWDPKPEPWAQAILEIVASGCTVVFRPGSGNRSMGIAIWEGDARHPAKWVYDSVELDEWASEIVDQAKRLKETP